MKIDLPDLQATQAFGLRLAGLLFPGAVVGLVGPLGAGKTHLVRAIAEGLGVPDGRVVTSPTFVLLQEYPGRLPIYHFDAYRLENPGAFLDLGAEEYLESEGVCLIEWADRVADQLPADRLWLTLTITGTQSRSLLLEATGATHESIIQKLKE